MADHYPEEVATPGSTPVEQLAVFPYCRCDEYRCAAGPYEVVPVQEENVTADIMRMCWKFVYKGCAINSPCCQKQTDDVDKIEFDSGDCEWAGWARAACMHATPGALTRFDSRARAYI